MKSVEYFSRADSAHGFRDFLCDYCDAKAVIVRKHVLNLGEQGTEIENIFLCRDHARKYYPQTISLLGERSPVRVRVFPLFDWLTCPLCPFQFSDNSARTLHMETMHSDFFERPAGETEQARGSTREGGEN